MRRPWLATALAVVLASSTASADDAPKPDSATDRSGWKAYRTGTDLLKSAPVAAFVDGVWSLITQLDTTLIDHTWRAPWPYGTLGHYTRRIMYGTSWTAMLTLESLVIGLASNGDISWMAEARYRTDWMVPFVAPSCAHTGAQGGCGVGLGSNTFVQIRPARSHWWFEAGGGWFEQRLLDDPLRTLTDSTWVLSPFSAVYEVKTNPELPIALDLYAGPGIYGGMHYASVHPTVKGADIYNFPWTELMPLEGGVGPGGRVEVALIFGGAVEAHGDLTVAPFLLGHATAHANSAAAPLDYARSGIPIWRRGSVGIGWVNSKIVPLKPSIDLFGAELSERRIDRLGYRGAMLRFDIPLRVPGAQ